MQKTRLTSSSIKVKLSKSVSDSKFKYLQHHSLNKSPTKNVPSFKTGSLRFLQPSSQTPNKFYDIPQFKSKKSSSFGFGTKTNFAKKNFIDPTRYRISSSFDLRKVKNSMSTSFGISRQDFYKGKQVKTSSNIGPGLYNLQCLKRKNSFYMGLKMNRNNETASPGPGSYNVSNTDALNESTNSKIKAPRLKTQYFQKAPLERYNNKVPGPGTYDLNASNSVQLLSIFKKRKPKLPQCPRFKLGDQNKPGPGHYELFSQFG